MKLIIAEKKDVALSICPVAGASQNRKNYFEGKDCIVSWAVGHLAGLYMPDDYGGKWAETWSFDQLPMIPEPWKIKAVHAKEQFAVLKSSCKTEE